MPATPAGQGETKMAANPWTREHQLAVDNQYPDETEDCEGPDADYYALLAEYDAEDDA